MLIWNYANKNLAGANKKLSFDTFAVCWHLPGGTRCIICIETVVSPKEAKDYAINWNLLQQVCPQLRFANGNILVGAQCQVEMKVPIQSCQNFCSFEAVLLVLGREQVKRLEIYSFMYNILLVYSSFLWMITIFPSKCGRIV